jgi:outer membrane protein TolC
MKKTNLFIFCLSIFATAQAQQLVSDSVFVVSDTARTFTLGDFYKLLIQHHPVARQAALLSDVARQEIRFARGNFDPTLESQFSLKQYNNTTYYQLFNGSIKFPNRTPVSPIAGVQRNDGKYLNPENYIGDEFNFNQTYVGINIPLAKGLWTDERRIAIKQAEVFVELMEAEQVKIINKLLLEAAKDYWQWYYSYYNYRVAHNTTKIGWEIFRRVKLNFDGGEASPMDTVQAKITLLERQVSQQEAFAEWKNSTLKVCTYLWDSLMNPVDLPMEFTPVLDSTTGILSENILEELKNYASTNHPELQKLNLKLQQLELDKRLVREYLKPKLDVSYYMLNQPFSPMELNPSFDFSDNYKLGVDFSIPLFLRKERAKLSQTKLKIASTTFERNLATRQVINDINTAHNYVLSNGLILQQQRSMVENYFRLMNAELVNLENGESDLFKINVQQEKLFQAQSKLIKIIAEYEKQKAVLYWAAAINPLTR